MLLAVVVSGWTLEKRNTRLFLYSSGHPGVKRKVLSGAFFSVHPDFFVSHLYTIFAVFPGAGLEMWFVLGFINIR